MKTFNFEEFADFLRHNNVRYVALVFVITCKNLVGDSITGEALCKFVLDLGQHGSLEDGFKRGYPHNFISTGERDFGKWGAIDSEFYRRLRPGPGLPLAEHD